MTQDQSAVTPEAISPSPAYVSPVKSVSRFDVVFQTKKFEVGVCTTDSTGYFEHNTMGDDYGGGLWFEPDERFERGLILSDFDGVSILPEQIEQALVEHGFGVDWIAEKDAEPAGEKV